MSEKPRICYLGDACCGCGACAARCPRGCITMATDSYGFLRPMVDAAACVGCGACEKTCPALVRFSEDEQRTVLWAKAVDDGLRERSSSGGVFGLLARRILSQRGAVVGAAWDEGCRSLRHVVVEDASGLDAIMRSKYVQSTVDREVYETVRHALRTGRPVLFCGTSCQVAAMRSYLGTQADSDLFLAVDVICHGVPSPRLWERWIDWRADRAGAAAVDVNMRSKTTGWLSFSAAYTYAAEKDGSRAEDGSVFQKDWYMKAFLANVSLRSSCYACPTKRCSGADVTLGDYWGIKSAHPEVDYDGGVSAVICNTNKGIKAIEDIRDQIACGPSTFGNVLAGNPSLTTPVAPHADREAFMAAVADGMPIERMMETWSFTPTLVQRVRGKLGRMRNKLRRMC